MKQIDTILGLDISTKTGVVLLDRTGADPLIKEQIHFGPRHGAKKVLRPAMERALMFHTALDFMLASKNKTTMFAVIEGYGFGRKQGMDSVITTVEIGTHLKQLLCAYNVPWIEVPPSNLKNYVGAPGNAKKAVVMEKVKERWGFDHDNDNIVDAFALAHLGKSLVLGGTGYDELQAKALKAVRGLEKNLPALEVVDAINCN